MLFYTYYKQWGNTIFYSYIDEEGKTHHTKINDYRPTLFVKTDNPESEFKSIYGYGLNEVKFDSIKDAKAFVEKYKHVDGMTIEGNTKFANQFVIELFEGKTPEYNASMLRGAIIDIEVTAPEFPKPTEAKYPVDLMTVYDTQSKIYTVFSLHNYDQSIDDTDAGKLKINFKKFNNEVDLLTSFVSYMQENSFNWISGWNSSGFDTPYLANRIRNLLGEKILNKLSPYGRVNIREYIDDYGKDAISVEIFGLTELDYMHMYKKHIYTPRENYKLDFICEAELGKKKLSYEEEGSLFNLSKTNPQKYVSYNLIDVLRLKELEDKLELFQVMYALGYYCFSNLDAGLNTVDPWECLIAKELYIRGMVPLARREDRPFRPYPGGYVAVPQVGLHKWEVSFDLNSLYPHIEMQVNISPETHIARKDLPEELIEIQDLLAVTDHKNYFVQCQNLVNKEVDLSVLKKYNVSMSANGQFYRKDIKGIIPAINEDLYNSRKKYKKMMLAAEQKLADAKVAKLPKSEILAIEAEVSRYNNLQLALKVLLNGGYGALANKYFLYFMVENAEAITTTGQVVNMWTSNRVNDLLNKILDNKKKKDYIVCGDTDSSYFELFDVVKSSGLLNESNDTIADFLHEFCKDVLTPEINEYTDELCAYFNNVENKMVWEREAIASSAIHCAKKRYAMLVIDSEGVRYKEPKLKIVGLESKTSSTPAWSKPLLEQCYKLCLEEKESEFHDFIIESRKTINSLDPSQIAIPSGINGIENYLLDDGGCSKGTPKHVRAAIIHNRLIKDKGLSHIDEIKSGGNLKYLSLNKPNPINEDVIGFEKYLPKEFGLDKYVNYNEAYTKGFEDPLINYIRAIGWTTEPVVSLF